MNRLSNRWFGVAVVFSIAFVGATTSAPGGSLEAPAAPSHANSAMFTLQDIYNKLNTRENVTKRTGGFAEPTAGPTNGTMHTLDQIMALVTNRAPVQKTGQTTPYATDDDGTLKIGVARPIPRFTIGTGVDGTNCVTDNLTGLMWARDANMFGTTDWGSALTNCNNLVYGGHDDWRLPNVRELLSLMDYGYYNPSVCNTAGTAKWAANNPFKNLIQAGYYWSSTVYPLNPATGALYVFSYYGAVGYHAKTATDYVWPVRGGGN